MGRKGSRPAKMYLMHKTFYIILLKTYIIIEMLYFSNQIWHLLYPNYHTKGYNLTWFVIVTRKKIANMLFSALWNATSLI